MIDALAVDRWSVQLDGWLHRASAPAKLSAGLAIILALVVSTRALPLAVVYAALLVGLVTSRVPPLPLLGLSLLPVALSGLFAITRLGTTWESAAVILEKGAISSLALLLLVSTTPSAQLFRLIRRLMPDVTADILYLAYRSLFVLIGRATAAVEALRLRSARASFIGRVRRNGMVAALTVLRATELATDQYAAMRIRGYPGPLGAMGALWHPRADLFLIASTAAVLAVALLGVTTIGDAFWLPFVPLLVAVALLVSSRR